ncbi:MAG: ribosome maturation factor RimM [Gammaproteobacteria bacterium]|nr:ribosome maturation factor RimM [Gammaproteobacteria bacterium]
MERNFVRLGLIAGAHGVRGWVRVISDTEPVAGILDYRPWHLRRDGELTKIGISEGRKHTRGVLAKLEGCDDREAAQDLAGAEVGVLRSQLPALDRGDYYWIDLIGATVQTTDGRTLGEVDHLMQTGANDVLVVKGERERLIPFIDGEVVKSVDLGGGAITVHWDPDF